MGLTLFAMHIPDGFLNPMTSLVTSIVAVAGIGFALYRLRSQRGDRLVPLIGVVAAGVFAGQMVNFPLLGLQASGHLLGGVLAAVVLGPWGAAVALSAVLVVQCFVFGDGGVTALGANITNMAIIGGMLGYLVYSALRQILPEPRGTVVAAMLASWLIVPVSALAFSVEMAAGGQYRFERLATMMLFYHVWIGVGESLLTGLVVAWIARVRPDVIYDPECTATRLERIGRLSAAGLTVALAVAVFIAPWASEFEDGLEKVAGRLGFGDRAVDVAFAPFPDYSLPEAAADTNEIDSDEQAAGQGSIWRQAGVVTAMMGVMGTLVTVAFAWTVSRTVQIARTRRTEAAHVA